MSKILIFCDQTNGILKSSTIELFTATMGTDHEVYAVCLGSDSKKSLETLAASYGVKKIYFNESADLNSYNSSVYSQIMSSIIKEESIDYILSSSSALARDLFPRVAAHFQAPCVSDCTELDFSNTTPRIRRPLYAGKCSAQVNFSFDGAKFILMRPNQIQVLQGNQTANPEFIETKLVSPIDIEVKDIVSSSNKRLDVSEASVVVSGGRGMQEASNFKLLEDLADVLGGSVGASRAVVDAGWVPHSMQVGQTGKVVAPNLYIACGISGAIQHLAGMSSSHVIVAINTDPEAPIFEKATYGIVGDALQVVPKLTEELKAML
jgi:electron transfer flavoprotein alpha subunit